MRRSLKILFFQGLPIDNGSQDKKLLFSSENLFIIPTMTFRGKILDRGRIVIPIKLRHSLGLEAGDEIVLREHNGALLIVSLIAISDQSRYIY